MTITQEDIATRALKRLRIIGASETPSAADMADAKTALNAMVQKWVLKGLDIDLGTILAGDGLHEAVVELLAQRIAPDYGRELTPQQVVSAREAMDQIWGYAWGAVTATFDSELLYIPAARSMTDTTTADTGDLDGGTA